MYITCYNVNYFVSQPVGLNFTSRSGFCQWVWILPVGLDCQWVWIWRPHGLDSLLYHVIYTNNCRTLTRCTTLFLENHDRLHHMILVEPWQAALYDTWRTMTGYTTWYLENHDRMHHFILGEPWQDAPHDTWRTMTGYTTWQLTMIMTMTMTKYFIQPL